MKKFYILLAFLLPIFNQTKACVDYHPDQPIITAYIDSTACGEFLIEVSNLQLAQGPAGAFCSCGINNLFEGPIEYVAFLDSITGDPIPGFEWFNFSPDASTAWDEVSGELDWNGWISEVNENGLLNVAVILVIRGQTGYSNCDEFNFQFGEFTSFSFGSDEWSDENNDLADTHQDVSDFYIDISDISFAPPSFFGDFDDWLFSFPFNIEQNHLMKLEFYPNPASNQIILKNATPKATVEIYGLTGQRIVQKLISTKNEVIDVSDLPKGVYLIYYRNKEIEQTERLIVN